MEKHSKVTGQATPAETIGIDLGDKISRQAQSAATPIPTYCSFTTWLGSTRITR